MPSKFIEQRQQSRRPLKTPVAFYANGNWDLKKYAIGQTLDVSTQGACVKTGRAHMPEIHSPLVLMLIPGSGASFSSPETSVQIRGKVVWVDPEAKQFGICFS